MYVFVDHGMENVYARITFVPSLIFMISNAKEFLNSLSTRDANS